MPRPAALLAVALVMQGRSRTGAATAAGMDRRSSRDRVHRFNAEGPAGLLDKPRSGRPPRLSKDQLRAFDALVESGPDLEADRFAHLALVVDDIDTVLAWIGDRGWKAQGTPQTIAAGARAGTRVVQAVGPDGSTIEFLQPPPAPSGD